MKIMLFCTNANRSGAPIQMFSLANSNGHDFVFVFGSSGPMVELAKERGEVHVLGALKSDFNILSDIVTLFKLAKLYRRCKPDVIHLHSTKAGFLGRLAASFTKFKSRLVYTFHGVPFDAGVKPIQKYVVFILEWLMSRVFDVYYIFLCECDRKKVVGAGIRIKRSSVIYNAVANRSNVFPDMSFKNCGIMIARVSWQKNHELLFNAFEMSELKNLIVVGHETDSMSFKAMARQICRQKYNQIDFVGETDLVSEFLAKADYLLLISRYEGVPLVILEAASFGMPVIATAVGGVPEVMDIIGAGITVPPGDLKCLVSGMNKYADADRLKVDKKKLENGIPLSLTKDQMFKKTYTVYKKIAAA